MTRGGRIAWSIALVLLVGVGVFVDWLMGRDQGWQAAYYPTKELSGTPVYRVDSDVNFDWGEHPAFAGFLPNIFSVRFDTCLLLARPESLLFRLGSDDGSRLFVDGELVIDNWRPQPMRWEDATANLEPGAHHLRVEYFDAYGLARVALEISREPSGARLDPRLFVVPERRWQAVKRLHRPVESPSDQPSRFCQGLSVPSEFEREALGQDMMSAKPGPFVRTPENCSPGPNCNRRSRGACDIGVVKRGKDQLTIALDYGRTGEVNEIFNFSPPCGRGSPRDCRGFREARLLETEVLIGRWHGVEEGPAITQIQNGRRKYFFDDDGDRNFDRSFEFGIEDQGIISGDFDGDGIDEIGLLEKRGPSLKWLLDHGDGGVAEVSFEFGRSTDFPIVGSWDGGPDEHVGVVQEDNGVLRWFLDTNHDSDWEIAFPFGQSGDRIITGDWNADGVTDAGLIRAVDGTLKWLLDYNTLSERGARPERSFVFGVSGDFPILCDWDADGDDDAGVVRVQGGRFRFFLDLDDEGRVSETTVNSERSENTTPIAGDWDGR